MLRLSGVIELPDHIQPGGFDHADKLFLKGAKPFIETVMESSKMHARFETLT